MSEGLIIFSVREVGLQYQVPVVDPIPEPIPDNLRPTIAITVPANNATVSGTVNITATATDNVAIAHVRFNINGVNFGEPIPGPGPYVIPWDTTQVSDGTYTIVAVATDTSGNQRVSAAVQVFVLNIPVLNDQVWSMPVSAGASMDPADIVIVFGGDSSKTYDVTLRFRGIVEWTAYSGGVQSGHFVTGGAPDSGTLSLNLVRNRYSLEVSNPSQVYWLNAYTSGSSVGVFVIDYTVTIPIKGGATLTLKARAMDNASYDNSLNLTVPVGGGDPPIVVSQPFPGQFIQVNVVSVVAE